MRGEQKEALAVQVRGAHPAIVKIERVLKRPASRPKQALKRKLIVRLAARKFHIKRQNSAVFWKLSFFSTDELDLMLDT